jgi:hypothetical protein
MALTISKDGFAHCLIVFGCLLLFVCFWFDMVLDWIGLLVVFLYVLCLSDFSRPHAQYLIAVDPCDGSSNIACNVPVGTIFAIWERKTATDQPVDLAVDALQTGREMVRMRVDDDDDDVVVVVVVVSLLLLWREISALVRVCGCYLCFTFVLFFIFSLISPSRCQRLHLRPFHW